MTAAWRAALEDARRGRVTTVAQQVWDNAFARAVTAALRTGCTSQEAVDAAYARTEAQRGQRPEQPKEQR